MKLIDIKDIDSLKNATEVLNSGGVLIMPTDTVYGIGCKLEESAISKLYKIKNRPKNQPTAVLMNEDCFESTSLFEGQLPPEFWSGQTTIIFEVKDFNISFPKVLLKKNKIGIRLPQHAWLKKLINQVGPIVASSANKSGEPTPNSFDDLSKSVVEESDLVVKSDEPIRGVASKVFDLTENKFLR